MSELNSTKILLGIEDVNTTINQIIGEHSSPKPVGIIKATLSYTVDYCPLCGGDSFSGQKKMIVKNGTKTSLITICKTGIGKTYLKLRKQRYTCRHCSTYFTCESNIVDRHCYISKHVKFSILKDLTTNMSSSRISENHNVSAATVRRAILAAKALINKKKTWLPTCLMVDEFRSMKSCEGNFSFICADGDSGKLFEVLSSRRLKNLEQYFNSYTLKARKKVKYIVTDMNAPYFSLVKKCFPKAKVIVDRFHIVQHLNTCFNRLWIRIMKSLNQKDKVQAKQYEQLKSLWKLLLKPESKLKTLDYSTKWRNFDNRQLSESDVLRRLLTISDELKIGYEYFQGLLKCFSNKDKSGFYELLNNMPRNIQEEMKKVKTAFKKYESGIKSSMRLLYSNGKIEAKNTHIKTLKRNCYGFGDFEITRIRIFLLNGLIQIS